MSETFDFFEQHELPGPRVSLRRAEKIAAESFELRVKAAALGSQQDANFLLTTTKGRIKGASSGERSVLKVANPAFSLLELEAQDAATRHLAGLVETGEIESLRLPTSRPGVSGSRIETVDVQGVTHHARIIEHLPGGTLSGNGYLAPRVLDGLGAVSGRVARGLAGFTHPGAERVLQWDLAHAGRVLERLAPAIPDFHERSRVLAAAAEALALLEPLAPELVRQVIHGDIADDNVVCSVDDATGYRLPDGVIDFGDVTLSWRVAELAVTVASTLHHAGMSALDCLPVIRAFNAELPLNLAEARALWPLVLLRAGVLVASGHQQAGLDAGNHYVSEGIEIEARIFAVADSVPLDVMTGVILAALGWAETEAALEAAADAPPESPILPGLDLQAAAGIDLSSLSDELDAGRWLDESAEAQAAAAVLSAFSSFSFHSSGAGAAAAAALTRYGERRMTRTLPLSPEPSATAALGIDVYAGQVQYVHAPYAGVLERSDAGTELVTATGRIVFRNLDSAIGSGTEIAAGQQLGTMGRVPMNSADLYRLGIQQIRGHSPAAPEFVDPGLFAGWRLVAPDPSPLLGLVIAAGDAGAPGLPAAELLPRRSAHFASVQEHYYQDPPHIERGWRHFLIDEDARCYLDMVNNVAAVGHGHPRIADAVGRQLRKLNTNSRFNYASVVELSERIAALLPDELDTVFLVNSGSEADDLALRIAWAWTGRRDVVAVREAYHGWTDATDAVSTSVADNPDALASRPDWVHTVPAPNSYRGEHRGVQAARYGAEAADAIRALIAEGRAPAAFLAEAYYGNAGGMPLPDGYLEQVYDAVRGGGGLAIADEVQVGYGRLGHWFWGFQQQNVVPDVVAIAKAMGNGHPLGAVITRRDIAENYRNQGYFFSSSGGSPVSSVTGLAVLDILADEGLQANARVVGDHLKAALERLGERHAIIGAVHGAGLYLGVEFVIDRSTLEPATRETTAICERMRELGVIIQPTGDRQNILKIKPPLTLSIEGADYFAAMLDRVLTEGYSFAETTRG